MAENKAKQTETDNQQTPKDFSKNIGKVLTKARQEKGLTILQVEKALNIRAEYLSSFEKNNYDNGLSSSYTQSFLKSYATYLDLDSDGIINELKEKGYIENTVKHNIPQPIENTIVPSKTIILVTLAILILLLTIWGIYALKQENKILLITVPDSVPTDEVKAVAENIDITEETTAEPVKQTEETKQETITAVKEEQPVAVMPETAQPVVMEDEVKLVFSNDVWVQVKADTGKIYVSKVFKRGEEYIVAKNSKIDIGKPESTKVLIGDVDHTPWKGDRTSIIKGMSSNPDDIKTMKIQTQKKVNAIINNE